MMRAHTTYVWHTQAGDTTMLTKTTFALAFALASASGALAAAKTISASQTKNVYNPTGAYVGTDPALNVRFELNRGLGPRG
jgi:hypothetical protein